MPRISSESVWEKSFNTEGTKATEFTEKRFRGRGAGTLLMVALLADGERNGKAVLFWRKRAGGERGVGAGEMFAGIEIEEEFSGVVEPVIGEAGVEEAGGGVGLGGAGGVAQNEEKLFDGGIFENGVEAIGFSVEGKFGGAGNLRGIAGADQRGDGEGFLRRVGNPMRLDTVMRAGRIPLQAMKTGEGGGLCVLDAQGEALAALDDVEIQRADGHARIIFVAVGIDVQGLRLRRLAIDEKPLREAARGRVQRHFVAVEVEHAEVGGSAGGHVNFVVGGGPQGVIAEVEPLQTCPGEPTLRFLELGGGMLAPSGDFALPPRALRQSPGRDEEGR